MVECVRTVALVKPSFVKQTSNPVDLSVQTNCGSVGTMKLRVVHSPNAMTENPFLFGSVNV